MNHKCKRISIDPVNAYSNQKEKAMVTARDLYLGFVYMPGANRGRYGHLLKDLSNSYLNSDDRYQKHGQNTQVVGGMGRYQVSKSQL
eukprot:12334532-Ditylum_brightwellii.AAC.1